MKSGWCGLHGKPDCDGCERHGKAATCGCAECANRQRNKGERGADVRGIETVDWQNWSDSTSETRPRIWRSAGRASTDYEGVGNAT